MGREGSGERGEEGSEGREVGREVGGDRDREEGGITKN